jgi:hypothetical protein
VCVQRQPNGEMKAVAIPHAIANQIETAPIEALNLRTAERDPKGDRNSP